MSKIIWNIVSLKYQKRKASSMRVTKQGYSKPTLEDTSKEGFISQMFDGADSFNQSLEK